MATLIFSAVGTLIGGPLGGSIGALLGHQVDTLMLGGGTREGPRLSELAASTSSYGYPIPRLFGRMRVAGQIIWATDLKEQREVHSNGKGKPATTQYTYSASFAVALSSREISHVGRIWADGKLLRGEAGDLKVGGTLRVHSGGGDQPPDPLLAAAEGAGGCPAYRGLAYAVFEDLQLGDFGNRIPALTFEVFADSAPLSLDLLLDGTIEDHDAAVPLDGLDGLSLEGPLAEMLAALDPLFPTDCDASASQFAIRPDRQQLASIALPEAAIADNDEDFGGKAGFTRKRGGPNESPLAVLRYYDIERDYQPGVQRAPGRPLPGQPRTIELPAALGAVAARRLIEEAAQRGQWARETIAWRTTWIDPAVRPGAIVTLPGQPGVWRVREWEWRSHGVELALMRLSPQPGASLPADPGRVAALPDFTAGASRIAVCELPWDGNPASPVPLILAATSSPSTGWGGCALFVDQGDGTLQPLGPSGRTRATIGLAVSALPAASPLLFDRRNQIEIDLVSDDFTLRDATMRQLAMGANRAVLGSEIIQFGRAAPLGNRRWQLSGLWRGRGGTETAITSHTVDEDFILLDGAGTPLDPETIGSSPGTRIAAIGLGDTEAVYAPIALRGIGSRPPSPVHGRLSRHSDGSASLIWTRRARGAWLWADGVETPLNEQREIYDVTFGSAANSLARWELAEPRLILPAAQFASLTASLSTGAFTIRQRGDRGVSEPLVIALS